MPAAPDDRYGRPIRLDVSVDWPGLKRAIVATGFTDAAVRATTAGQASSGGMDLAVLLRRTQEATPYHALMRLFALGQSVPRAAIAAALAPIDLDSLCEAGLLLVEGHNLRSVAMLLPLENLLTLRDFGIDVTGASLAADYVPPISVSSLLLASFTVRRGGESVLDVGTGGGVQALLAAGHAKRVLGTDTNLRALNYAAVTARMNEMPQIELRDGSLFEPVGDEKFDLVVSNPPFVISPESKLIFRDSGFSGDEVCRQLILGIPQRMNEGGFATVLFNWHHSAGDDWIERPKSWLANSGCDAWLIRFRTADPLSYAASWGRDQLLGRDDPTGSQLDEWLAYFRGLGIGAISFGILILRRRSAGAHWLRTDTLREAPGQYSRQIQRIFSAEDLLQASPSPADLLGQWMSLAEEHRLDQTLRAKDGDWAVAKSMLSQTPGFDFATAIDGALGAVLAACDGSRTLEEALRHVGKQFRVPAERLIADFPPVIARLAKNGYFDVKV
jgi:SAM-dependent methyltransferase